jgi:hypothetical protein
LLNNQPRTYVAMTAATSWEIINPGASTGRIPEKLSVNERASVTAGLAKLVDDVNQ